MVLEVACCPPTVTTTARLVPCPLGIAQLIVVSEKPDPVAGHDTPPTVTEPAVEKDEPWMTMTVPPDVDAEAGEIDVIEGGEYEKVLDAVAICPATLITTALLIPFPAGAFTTRDVLPVRVCTGADRPPIVTVEVWPKLVPVSVIGTVEPPIVLPVDGLNVEIVGASKLNAIVFDVCVETVTATGTFVPSPNATVQTT